MTYNEAIKYLEGSAVLGSKQGLSAFKGLLSLMGSPEKRLKIIHVAGTNGKGSFCTYTESILRAAGFTTGLFTSPHLIRYNERIAFNGEPISDEDFADEIDFVKAKTKEFFGSSNQWFSFFEIITDACLSYFYKKSPDFVILETGLGGRLDATNAAESPLFTAITRIALDHTEFLGNTIEEIAAEKCGIIKENRPCVSALQCEEAEKVIRAYAAEKNAPLLYEPNPEIKIIKNDLKGLTMDIKTHYYSYKGLVSGMGGSYQPQNIAAVLLGIEALRKQGYAIPDKAVYEGIKTAKIKGRTDIISKSPLIIADGAHNLNAAEEFDKTTAEVKAQGKKITLLTGVLADKNPEKLIKALSKNADRVILTVPPSKRAFNPEGLTLEGKDVYFEPDPEKACKLLKGFDDSVIFITGSLYLTGKIYALLKENESLFS